MNDKDATSSKDDLKQEIIENRIKDLEEKVQVLEKQVAAFKNRLCKLV